MDADKTTGSPRRPGGGRTVTDRVILHVDMDAFFVSVEEVLDPSLKGKPVIVGPSTGGGNASGPFQAGRGVVAAASYAARRYGIHSAMPLARARRLCPHAIFLPGSHRLYGEFSRRIFQILAGYSPAVEPMSMDEAFVDLTGCGLLHGPVPVTAGRMRNEIKQTLGIDASIGIAANKLVAKIASGCAKPSGMLWVAPGYERAFLSPLPVDRIPGVGPRSGRQLRRMGIKTVGDLALLPRDLLEDVFGQWGAALYRKARGLCDSPVLSEESGARSISRETTFGEDTTDLRLLESTLSYLTEKVSAQLREAGLRAGCVTLKLRYSDFKTVTRSRTLAQPADADHVLFRSVVALFHGLFTRRIRVRLIGVALTSLAPPGPVQGHLFDTAWPEQWDRLYRGIDKIRAKYGFRSILRATTARGGKLAKTLLARDRDH